MIDRLIHFYDKIVNPRKLEEELNNLAKQAAKGTKQEPFEFTTADSPPKRIRVEDGMSRLLKIVLLTMLATASMEAQTQRRPPRLPGDMRSLTREELVAQINFRFENTPTADYWLRCIDDSGNAEWAQLPAVDSAGVAFKAYRDSAGNSLASKVWTLSQGFLTGIDSGLFASRYWVLTRGYVPSINATGISFASGASLSVAGDVTTARLSGTSDALLTKHWFTWTGTSGNLHSDVTIGGNYILRLSSAPAANIVSLLGAADYAAVRVLLGLTIGTNVQAQNANLTTLSGPGNWKVFYTNESGVVALDLGSEGQVLTSNGETADPAFEDPAASGSSATVVFNQDDRVGSIENESVAGGGGFFVMYWLIRTNGDGSGTYDFSFIPDEGSTEVLASVDMSTNHVIYRGSVQLDNAGSIYFAPEGDGTYDVRIAVVQLF